MRDLLYLSEGPGPDGRVTFREVGERLGIDPDAEYGLGALFTDVDRDHDLDLYVANDTNPSRLYVNEPASGQDDPGRLGFALREVGTEAAVADAGSAMGVAGDDYTGDGRDDLYVTNLAGQTPALFVNRTRRGTPTFTDGLPTFGDEAPNGSMTGWGTTFVDLDLDTDLDLLVANGEIPIVDLGLDAETIGAYGNLDRRRCAGPLRGHRRRHRPRGAGPAQRPGTGGGGLRQRRRCRRGRQRRRRPVWSCSRTGGRPGTGSRWPATSSRPARW